MSLIPLTLLATLLGAPPAADARIVVIEPWLGDEVHERLGEGLRDDLVRNLEAAVADQSGACIVSGRQLEIARELVDDPKLVKLCGVDPATALTAPRVVSLSVNVSGGLWSMRSNLLEQGSGVLLAERVHTADAFPDLIGELPMMVQALFASVRQDARVTGKQRESAADADANCSDNGGVVAVVEVTERWRVNPAADAFAGKSRLELEAARIAARNLITRAIEPLEPALRARAIERTSKLGTWLRSELIAGASLFVRTRTVLEESVDDGIGSARLVERLCIDLPGMQRRVGERAAFLEPVVRPRWVVVSNHAAVTQLLEAALSSRGYEVAAAEALAGKLPRKKKRDRRHIKRGRALVKRHKADFAMVLILEPELVEPETQLPQLSLRLTALNRRGGAVALARVLAPTLATEPQDALGALGDSWKKELPVEVERFLVTAAATLPPVKVTPPNKK